MAAGGTAAPPAVPTRTTQDAPQKSIRLAAAARERLIIEEATRFFAELGPVASTTDLARRLGITQPLLYRYFPTKEKLIERVYVDMWRTLHNPRWEALIGANEPGLEDRLTAFYVDYSQSVLSYAATRLALFVQLHDLALENRYYAGLRDTIFPAIVRALRRDLSGLPESAPPSEDEIESIQTLHGGIVHLAQRRWLGPPGPDVDMPHLIRLKVRLFLTGYRGLFGRVPRSAKARQSPA